MGGQLRESLATRKQSHDQQLANLLAPDKRCNRRSEFHWPRSENPVRLALQVYENQSAQDGFLWVPKTDDFEGGLKKRDGPSQKRSCSLLLRSILHRWTQIPVREDFPLPEITD